MSPTQFYFANTYGSGTYNTSTYNNATSTTTGSTSGSTTTATPAAGSTGTLANTGFDLILGATIGSVIIFSALVIRFWKKPAKKQNTTF